ncbi:MAG: LysR family transcriptional regulator [Nevskia sp.]|nr:LysR family transcriptional regulator [Nevskia sp.]
MDRLEAMAILLQAVETGSLSAAGRRLGMPLATVSRKVSDLEAHLKTRLLLRGGRKLQLTDAGRSYVAACRRIMEDVVEAERAAAGEYSAPQGELVVTVPVALSRMQLLPIATEFLRAYPDVQLRLVQSDRVVNLSEEHVDLAVRIGLLPDSSLIATRVGVTRRVLCASPAYLAARGQPRTLEELEQHDCIAFEPMMYGSRWVFGAEGSARSVEIRMKLAVDTAEAAVEGAAAGLGIARVLCYQAAEAVAAGRLQWVLPEFDPPASPISLVYPSQRLLPLKLRAFLDFAAPRLRMKLLQEC